MTGYVWPGPNRAARVLGITGHPLQPCRIRHHLTVPTSPTVRP
jgi:hypothetical protein